MGALPLTPFKKLFKKSFLKIFKNFSCPDTLVSGETVACLAFVNKISLEIHKDLSF